MVSGAGTSERTLLLRLMIEDAQFRASMGDNDGMVKSFISGLGSVPGVTRTSQTGLASLREELNAGARAAQGMGLESYGLMRGLQGMDALTLTSTGGIAALTFGIVGGTTELVKMGSALDQQEARLSAWGDMSVTQAKAVGDAFLATSGQTIFSVDQQLEALTKVEPKLREINDGQLSVGQSAAFMAQSEALATVTGTDLTSTSVALADVLKVYGLTLGDAAEASNVMLAATQLTGVGLDEFAQAADRARDRLGPFAPTILQTATFMKVADDAGISGSRGVMLFTNAIEKLADPTPKASYVLDQLGVSAKNTDGSFKSLDDTMPALLSSLANYSDAEKLGALTEIFGATQAGAMLSIIDKGPAIWDADTQSIKNNTTATDQSAKSTKDLVDRWTEFHNILGSGIAGIGQNLTAPLDRFFTTIGEGFKNAGDWGTVYMGIQNGVISAQEGWLALLNPSADAVGREADHVRDLTKAKSDDTDATKDNSSAVGDNALALQFSTGSLSGHIETLAEKTTREKDATLATEADNKAALLAAQGDHELAAAVMAEAVAYRSELPDQIASTEAKVKQLEADKALADAKQANADKAQQLNQQAAEGEAAGVSKVTQLLRQEAQAYADGDTEKGKSLANDVSAAESEQKIADTRAANIAKVRDIETQATQAAAEGHLGVAAALNVEAAAYENGGKAEQDAAAAQVAAANAAQVLTDKHLANLKTSSDLGDQARLKEAAGLVQEAGLLREEAAAYANDDTARGLAIAGQLKEIDVTNQVAAARAAALEVERTAAQSYLGILMTRSSLEATHDALLAGFATNEKTNTVEFVNDELKKADASRASALQAYTAWQEWEGKREDLVRRLAQTTDPAEQAFLQKNLATAAGWASTWQTAFTTFSGEAQTAFGKVATDQAALTKTIMTVPNALTAISTGLATIGNTGGIPLKTLETDFTNLSKSQDSLKLSILEQTTELAGLVKQYEPWIAAGKTADPIAVKLASDIQSTSASLTANRQTFAENAGTLATYKSNISDVQMEHDRLVTTLGLTVDTGKSANELWTDTTELLRNVKTSAQEAGNAIADLTSKPTVEELRLKSQVADLNSKILDQEARGVDSKDAGLVAEKKQLDNLRAQLDALVGHRDALNADAAAAGGTALTIGQLNTVVAQGTPIIASGKKPTDDLTVSLTALGLSAEGTAGKITLGAAPKVTSTITLMSQAEEQIQSILNSAGKTVTPATGDPSGAAIAAMTAQAHTDGETVGTAFVQGYVDVTGIPLPTARTSPVTIPTPAPGSAASGPSNYATGLPGLAGGLPLVNGAVPVSIVPSSAPKPPPPTGGDTPQTFGPGNKSGFVQYLEPFANYWSSQTGIPPAMFIAMNASESNFGNVPTYFGIKAAAGSANSGSFGTSEYVNGQYVQQNDTFQTVGPAQGYQNFIDWLQSHPLTVKVLQSDPGNVNALISAMGQSNYFTAPIGDYQALISSLMQQIQPLIGNNTSAINGLTSLMDKTAGRWQRHLVQPGRIAQGPALYRQRCRWWRQSGDGTRDGHSGIDDSRHHCRCYVQHLRAILLGHHRRGRPVGLRHRNQGGAVVR